MSHEHITILYLFWQQKQKIRRWKQLNCEFSCIKTQCKRWWKTEVLLAETLQSNHALSVILLPDIYSDAKLLSTKRRRDSTILPLSTEIFTQRKKCGHVFFHKETAVSDLVGLVWIKCVSDIFPETIHTHAYVVHGVEQHCAVQEAHIQTKIQHTLSHLLFNISAPLLSPAWRGLISCFWH